MTPKIIVKRVDNWRSWWPGNWTTPTNLMIRIHVVKRSVMCQLECEDTVSCCKYI